MFMAADIFSHLIICFITLYYKTNIYKCQPIIATKIAVPDKVNATGYPAIKKNANKKSDNKKIWKA